MPNASFQKTVNQGIPFGQPGDLYSSAPMVVTAYMAASDLVPGKGAFDVDGGTANRTIPKAVVGTPDTQKALFCGIVTRMTTGLINDYMSGYTDVINAGREVQVLSQGEILVSLESTPNVGDKVYVRPGGFLDVYEDDAADTGFTVVEVIDPGTNLVAISSWRRLPDANAR
jgi:hypothetical protein